MSRIIEWLASHQSASLLFCRAKNGGEWQWFVRLSYGGDTVIKYGDEPENTLLEAFQEMKGKGP